MKSNKKKILFTLDLNTAKKPNYYLLNKLMKNLGFKKFSPNKEINLPHNTYFGVFKEDDIVIRDFKMIYGICL